MTHFETDRMDALEVIRVRLGARSHLLLVISLVFLGAAVIVPGQVLSLALLLSGLILGVVLLAVRIAPIRSGALEYRESTFLNALLEGDPTPAMVTDADGRLSFRNGAATALLGVEDDMTAPAALSGRIGNAGPLVRRLLERTRSEGSAREDVITVSGHARLSLQALDKGHFLWRLEEFGRGDAGETVEMRLPFLSVGRGQSILYMNKVARDLVGGRPQRLEELLCNPQQGLGECSVIEMQGAEGPIRRRAVQVLNKVDRREYLLLPVEEEEAAPVPAPVPDVAALRQRQDGSIWDVLDGLPVPILRLSSAGVIELANAPARQMLAIPATPELPMSDLMEGLGRSISEWLAEAAADNVESKTHSEFLRLSRSEREVFVQVAIKAVDLGGRTGLIAVLSDATELKTLEAQFVQSQKMQAIGQLAGGVAHDFNNLLTAISGHCDLLLLRHDHGDPEYGDLIQINQNANRAAALVGQLLAFSRKQTLRPETLDLRTTLSDLTHLLNRLVGETVKLTLNHDRVLPQVRADKRQLEQVLMNLVVNARDAMPNGGEIRIVTEMLHLTEEMHRDRATVSPGDYVQVTVTDTGSGIPQDKLPKVFEPFFTTKRVGEGTGLGLSTAYGIIKQSGGFIFVDSVPGEGTSFSLLFPAQTEMLPVEAPAPAPEPVSTESRGDGVVLLVEDEAPVRAFASRALRLRGYTVLEAESAEQALETLESARTPIDIFVTDVIMPGMNGPTWVRQALEKYPGTKVVFVSGYAEDSFNDSSAKIPNSVFLPKPFSLAELTETVRKQLESG